MADFDSSLPVKSMVDSDDRVQVKIVDSTTPSQQAEVNTDGQILVEVHGDNPAAGDETLRLSELGAPNPDGDYDGTNNTKPASIGNIAHDRASSPADTDQNLRVTGVTGSTDSTHHSMDVALHNGDGEGIDDSNPLPVYNTDDPGTETLDYNTSAAVASDATVNHDYSVASGDTFKAKSIIASGSGKIKVEFQIGDGGAAEVFATQFVGFSSTANPQVKFDFSHAPISILGTANTTTIRMIITNLDNQAQDLYSTLVGIDV